MTALRMHLRYESTLLRRSLPLRLTVLGAVLVAGCTTAVVALYSQSYLDLSATQYWALIATNGSTFTWPPLFAYLLGTYGVLAWSMDAGGEPAYVGYTAFTSRWRFAAVRSAVVTCVVAAIAVAVVVVSLATERFVADGTTPHVHLQVIMVKTAWMVVCGVGFAHLGAALCVVLRSTPAAVALVLILPTVVEPILVQLVELVPSFQRFAGAAAYLPFKVSADAVGEPRDYTDFGSTAAGQHQPLQAALVSLAFSCVAIAVVQWRYCRNDGGRDR